MDSTNDPLIRAALERFEGRVVSVKTLRPPKTKTTPEPASCQPVTGLNGVIYCAKHLRTLSAAGRCPQCEDDNAGD